MCILERVTSVHNDVHGSLSAELTAEGVYLKGQGVVFTVTLPPLPSQPSQPKSPATKPLSEWEQIRMQLRGEEPKKPPRRPASLVWTKCCCAPWRRTATTSASWGPRNR